MNRLENALVDGITWLVRLLLFLLLAAGVAHCTGVL